MSLFCKKMGFRISSKLLRVFLCSLSQSIQIDFEAREGKFDADALPHFDVFRSSDF